MTRLTRILVSLAALALVSASVASAYVLLNPARRWFPADLPRVVHVDNRGIASIADADHGLSAALGAITVWNTTSLIVSGVAENVQTYTIGDGRSDVVFGDPFSICTGGCLAATYIASYDSSQKEYCDGLGVVRYTDADVAFNVLGHDFTSTGQTTCSNEYYVETVMSHEIGHVIGLAHSQQTTALMYPFVTACDNKPIAADDLAGRDALYDCSAWCDGSGALCNSDSDCCSNKCRGTPKKCKG